MNLPLLAVAHLRLRLLAVNRDLRLAVSARTHQNAELDRPDLARVCVTDRQVSILLDQVDLLATADGALTDRPLDVPGEAQLRRTAAEASQQPPLDELTARFDLTRDEQDALLLVVASELEPAYERIYAYVMDDLGRRLPCVELLARVGAVSPTERLLRRHWLSPAGTLRRSGLLVEIGEAPTGGRQELRLADGLLDFLLGVRLDLAAIATDPGRFNPPESVLTGTSVPAGRLARAGVALSQGTVEVVAVWGGGAHEEVVASLADHAGRLVRRLDASILPTDVPTARKAVRAALCTAAATGAILWVLAPTSDVPESAAAEAVLAEELTASSVPTCLTGPAPWRPPGLLAARPCLELEPVTPTHSERLAMWSAAIPEADEACLERLAARFKLSGRDLRAVALLARTEAVAANGQTPAYETRLERAASAVAQRHTSRLASTDRPDRSPDELILPPSEFRQVMEVAAFFDAWPLVAERWGFASIAGGRGLKVLFTGEPGTGKTLAAEVIASQLGLSLVKVDLSRLVSKWVGETEKNLDIAFREAEASNAVLFFDEADALFGKRGQVENGTDRWANLEVGFLLQRLETFDGLAVLASNLRENIDAAFTRRFSFVIHFPRPGQGDRRRLWQLAFPPEAPMADDVDLDTLAQLDLTGAGITAAARTAALLAADASAEAISMAHAVWGVSRQYQREARVLRRTDLGRYGGLLEGHA